MYRSWVRIFLYLYPWPRSWYFCTTRSKSSNSLGFFCLKSWRKFLIKSGSSLATVSWARSSASISSLEFFWTSASLSSASSSKKVDSREISFLCLIIRGAGRCVVSVLLEELTTEQTNHTIAAPARSKVPQIGITFSVDQFSIIFFNYSFTWFFIP